MPATYKDFEREPSKPHQCMHHSEETGVRCRATAMHNEYMCYHHRDDDIPTVIQNDPFLLERLNDHASIQHAVTQVAARLACNHMDLKRAGLLLQSFQIAALNLAAYERIAAAPPIPPLAMPTTEAPAADVPTQAAPSPSTDKVERTTENAERTTDTLLPNPTATAELPNPSNLEPSNSNLEPTDILPPQPSPASAPQPAILPVLEAAIASPISLERIAEQTTTVPIHCFPRKGFQPFHRNRHPRKLRRFNQWIQVMEFSRGSSSVCSRAGSPASS